MFFQFFSYFHLNRELDKKIYKKWEKCRTRLRQKVPVAVVNTYAR